MFVPSYFLFYFLNKKYETEITKFRVKTKFRVSVQGAFITLRKLIFTILAVSVKDSQF